MGLFQNKRRANTFTSIYFRRSDNCDDIERREESFDDRKMKFSDYKSFYKNVLMSLIMGTGKIATKSDTLWYILVVC